METKTTRKRAPRPPEQTRASRRRNYIKHRETILERKLHTRAPKAERMLAGRIEWNRKRRTLYREYSKRLRGFVQRPLNASDFRIITIVINTVMDWKTQQQARALVSERSLPDVVSDPMTTLSKDTSPSLGPIPDLVSEHDLGSQSEERPEEGPSASPPGRRDGPPGGRVPGSSVMDKFGNLDPLYVPARPVLTATPSTDSGVSDVDW